MQFELYELPFQILRRMDVAWTLILLIIRFTTLFMFLPGLGMGMAGVVIRMPAIIMMAFASLGAGSMASVPADPVALALQVGSEVLFGAALGFIPLLVVAAVQLGGSVASMTMGLQPSQLIDPTTQLSLPDLSRIYSDLTVILFLLLGGHHLFIHAAAGLGSELEPGTFVVGKNVIDVLIDRTGEVFRLGLMLASPILVALLMTNFVMGLISKAVPTVNIFIVSFPLTIGIGLLLSALALPEVVALLRNEILSLEPVVAVLTEKGA